MRKKSRFWVFVLALLAIGAAHAQSRDYPAYRNIPGNHSGAVTALLRDERGRILSAGEDGFLEIWNLSAAEERFQVSHYPIRFLVLRPGKPEAAVVESDGFSVNSVSAWNYETKKRLFTLRFRDSISSINYSAAGSFLIVSRSGFGGTVLLDPETGRVLDSPELPGSITMVSTGRSERNMVCYQPSGILSYWNLETKNETQRFSVPSNLQNPVLFGNNRFLTGFDSNGLLVLDAVTGAVLARETSVRQGSIFTEDADSTRFWCFSTYGGGNTVYSMEINLYGVLTITSRRYVSISEVNCGVSAGGDNVILGTRLGYLWLVAGTGASVLETQNQEGILDIAVSSSNIALVIENGSIVYLPLDYAMLEDGLSLMAETPGGNQAYTGISSSPLPSESRFLLWENGRSTPMVISPNSRVLLDKFPMRYPLRSAAMLGGNILFLDTTGVVSILDRGSGETLFSYSAAGSVDAAFVDIETIIIGRNAAGNTPFMTVNFLTGETVPLPYPGILGIKVYRGGSGAIYGAVITQAAGNVSTSIVALDLSNPARSETIVEYNGEDPFFVMAESGGNFATTLGSGMAALHLNRGQAEHETIFFEGATGFPVKITDGGRFFVALDGEGTVSWHDNRTGRALAVFRLYPSFWVLERSTLTSPLRGVINAIPWP